MESDSSGASSMARAASLRASASFASAPGAPISIKRTHTWASAACGSANLPSMRIALRNSARASSRSRRVLRSLKKTPRALARTRAPVRFMVGIGGCFRRTPHTSAAKLVAISAANAAKVKKWRAFGRAGVVAAGVAIQR